MMQTSDNNGSERGPQSEAITVVDSVASYSRDSAASIRSDREILAELVAHNRAQRVAATALLHETQSRARHLRILGGACWVLAIIILALTLVSLGFDKAAAFLAASSNLQVNTGELTKFAPAVLVIVCYVAYKLTSAGNQLMYASFPLANVLNWQKDLDSQPGVRF